MGREEIIPSVADLPRPPITLPINGGDYERPDPDLIERLYAVSSATASAILGMPFARSAILGMLFTRTPLCP